MTASGEADRRSGTRSGPADAWVLATFVIGMTVAAVVREGAFWRLDAITVGMGALVVIGIRLGQGLDRRTLCVLAAAGALAGWWLVRAILVGEPVTFFPFGVSVLSFAAAFVAVRPLRSTAGREAVAYAVAGIGAATAVLGFIAFVTRWYPIVMPAQNLWRLSGTITYADAVGLLLGVALLLALGLDTSRPLPRIFVALCLAGLIATQSRGAVGATLVGLPFVPWRSLRAALWPGLLGLAAGAVAVATSPFAKGSLLPLGALVIAGFGAPLRRRRPVPTVPDQARDARRLDRRALAALAAGAVVLVAPAAYALRTPIERRIELGSTGDRITEWTAAARQWWSSPFIGVGPDRLLTFHSVDGTFAHFAHNEYLQIAADSGVVGLLLLGLLFLAVIRNVRRFDVLSSCAVGALIAFAGAGAVDFDWHLPALGLIAGLTAGLARWDREKADLEPSDEGGGGRGGDDIDVCAGDPGDGIGGRLRPLPR